MMVEPTKLTTAVLGGGVMAQGLVRNLARRDRLRLHNRTASVWAESLLAPGAERCASPASGANGADVVVSSVSDDVASRAVWLGRNGALSALSPGAVAIETSTLSASWIAEWAAAVIDHGGRPVEAALTGGRARAEAGSLVCFVGADPNDFAWFSTFAQPLMERAYHFGPVGAATRFKLAHNTLAATILAALCETLTMLDRCDVDQQTAIDVFASYGWAQNVTNAYAPRLVERDFEDVNCRLALMAKDLAYASRLPGGHGTLSTATTELFARAARTGLGDLDMGAILTEVERAHD